jgi:hypothetical protein
MFIGGSLVKRKVLTEEKRYPGWSNDKKSISQGKAAILA